MRKVFVIAEAGVNHNGDEARAMEMISVAARCGADAVKFQTFSAEKVVSKGVSKAEYQERETGPGDQFSMIKSLELDASAFSRLADHARSMGIEFMSTPFDELSTDMLLDLGMERIKIPSGEITNLPFLEFLAGKRKPVILSTGMSDLIEVGAAVSSIENVWGKEVRGCAGAELTLLHCTSNYPASPDSANLRAMTTLADRFSVPVGYSDHTLGDAVAIAAVALGAAVIEKHFTLDNSLPGPDHRASLNPAELMDMVARIRLTERALGDGVKKAVPSELPIRDLVRRSVTLTRSLPAGAVISASDLAVLRPGTGISPVDVGAVVGRRLKDSLPGGTTLKWSDLC